MSDDEFERLCRSIETAVDSPLALLEAESPSDQDGRETGSPPDDSILEEADSPQDNTVLENSSASLESSANQTVVENPDYIPRSSANKPENLKIQPEKSKSEKAEAGGEDDDDDDEDGCAFIDSFLEETVGIRQIMFSEQEFKSSTPKISRATSRLNSETDDLWKNTRKILDRYTNMTSAASDETRPVNPSASQSDLSRTTCPEPDRSQILAGNMLQFKDKDGKDLDLSLLDHEDWEDDHVHQMTVDQILAEITLLDDSDSDEEEESGELHETTVKAAPEPEPEKPVLKPVSPVKPKLAPHQPKINRKDLKNIDVKYYRELEDLYWKYRDNDNIAPIPPIHSIRRPRIFRDKSGNILGFDSLKEYIDNNHPLWCNLRSKFIQLLYGIISDADMAEFVHKQWNSGLTIDVNQNLTCFPRKKFTQPQAQSLKDPGSVPAGHFGLQSLLNDNQTMDQKKEKLMDMYKNAGENEGLRQKEDERFLMYQSLNVSTAANPTSLIDAEELRADCGFCFRFCLCSPGRPSHGTKRRREGSGGGGSVKKRRSMPMRIHEHVDVILQRLKRKDKERGAKIIKAIGESYSLNACYSRDVRCDEQIVKELNSYEAVYDDFKEYYRSPYARYNPVEDKTVEDDFTHPLIEDY